MLTPAEALWLNFALWKWEATSADCTAGQFRWWCWIVDNWEGDRA